MDSILHGPDGRKVSAKVIQSAPSLIGLGNKSLNNPSAEDRCISSSVQAHRGCDFPQPILFDRKIIGYVEGRRNSPEVTFRRVPEYVWQCGFATYDQLISAMTAGQRYSAWFTKTATAAPTANNWYDLWIVGGTPAPTTYTGTAFTANSYTDASTGALYTMGNVSTATKHILSMWALSSGGTPSLIIYDRVLDYQACTFNAAANQAMTNTNTAQRYVSAGQSAMKIFIGAQAVNGSTAANLTQLRYTNQAGTTLQAMPTSPLPAFIISAAVASSTLGSRCTCPATTSGTLPWGPYVPLAVGDSGAQLIHDYTTSAANTGSSAMVLMRPLFSLGTATAGVISQIDGIYQIANLERIFDGACLSLLAYYPAATATTWMGAVDLGWG